MANSKRFSEWFELFFILPSLSVKSQWGDQTMQEYFGPQPKTIEFDSERKAFHRGDGSHKRYENREEYHQRREQNMKAQHWENKAAEHKNRQKFKAFRELML